MSEPVTQSEVEDMLSSIRRLVGETRKSAQAPKAQVSADKLVLTPQQRVPGEQVLMLKPENAVNPNAEWQEYEEPPLTGGTPQKDDEPFVLEPAARKVPARSDVSELTAKIAALETAIARTVDQWEPDGAGRDAYAGTSLPAMAWHDGVDLDAMGRPLTSRAQERPNESPADGQNGPSYATSSDTTDTDETVIDEAALRQLVAEIVRSELQGTLGERITRNVRKLVRREIHRALIAQKLE